VSRSLQRVDTGAVQKTCVSQVQLDVQVNPDTNAEIATFDHPNTDRMELRFQREETLEADHLPVVDDEVVPPTACHEALFNGFEAGYRFLMSNQAALLADDGPLSEVADTSLRVLLRPTRDYGEVKRRIRESASLRTGVPFGLAAERLARSVVGDDTAWPVYRHERRALRRYDVPRFTVAGDETVVRHDGEPVAELPDAAPADRVRRRIAELSTTDLTEPLDYLRLAFTSLAFRFVEGPLPVWRLSSTNSSSCVPSITSWAASTITSAVSSSSSPSRRLARAAACFTWPRASMNRRAKRRSLIGKFSLARCVWAP